ncbi:MAG TPA: hypothetical protein VND64_05185 [Pirellulales bacterium]|nr:hypothetical protein [Pirellulales bacterium]
MDDPGVEGTGQRQFPESPARRSSQPGSVWAPARGLAKLLYSHNPFYLLSAWLVFSGLRASFDTGGQAIAIWALIGGLAGYAVLLAITACVLIRLGRVWEDIRTLVLLVLLMFVAISVSLDDALANELYRGACWLAVGLVFAIAVSEGLLRGLRVRLRLGFRLPYYLLLALFFLYPVALGSVLTSPSSAALQWGLFGFSVAAGVAALTLLPAVRRGPHYVRDNGTPWPWPWFPWTWFGLMGLAVCMRSYYLCMSLHFVGGRATIFGGYFLVPFLLAANVVLLELAIVAKNVACQRWALAAPLVLSALATVGPVDEPVYLRFLSLFSDTLGASPLYLSLTGAAVFYGFCWLRRVPTATSALSLALAGMACLDPRAVDLTDPLTFHGWPLVAIAMVQSVPLAARRDSRRALFVACLLVAAWQIEWGGTGFAGYEILSGAHLLLVAVLAVGAAFDDPFARLLRWLGAGLLLAVGIAMVVGVAQAPSGWPWWSTYAYLPMLAAIALAYGVWAGPRAVCYAVAVIHVANSLAPWLFRGYMGVRRHVAGLDQLTLGAAFFLVALAISLLKVGALERWRRWRKAG